MADVVYLHGQAQSIAQFILLGASGHRQLEQILAAGRLPVERVVLDSGAFHQQPSGNNEC